MKMTKVKRVQPVPKDGDRKVKEESKIDPVKVREMSKLATKVTFELCPSAGSHTNVTDL